MSARKYPPLLQRIWAKVTPDKKTGCWGWNGVCNPKGYARVSVNGDLQSVHRVMHEIFVGPIPEAFEVDHLCCNPNCVNPAHLEAISREENISRALRHNGQLIPKKTVDFIMAAPETARSLAKKFGISPDSAERIKRGDHWSQNKNKLRADDGQKIRRRDRLSAGKEWTEYQVLGSWGQIISRHDTATQAKTALENMGCP